MSFTENTLGDYLDALGARQATPGGGAAAAISAAHACALAEMSAQYTTGKKWTDRAEKVQELIQSLQANRQQLLTLADNDADAYGDLQRSWKDPEMSADEKSAIEARALSIPCDILSICQQMAQSMQGFLVDCNPMIISDAQAAIHLFSGAAHAAFHTAMVNSPKPAVVNELQDQLAIIAEATQAALRRS